MGDRVVTNADDREDEAEGRSAAGLHPIGSALRTTYDAENHDSLGSDLTGLMLELARVDAPPLATFPAPTRAAPPPPAPPPSWLRRLWGRSPL